MKGEKAENQTITQLRIKQCATNRISGSSHYLARIGHLFSPLSHLGTRGSMTTRPRRTGPRRIGPGELDPRLFRTETIGPRLIGPLPLDSRVHNASISITVIDHFAILFHTCLLVIY